MVLPSLSRISLPATPVTMPPTSCSSPFAQRKCAAGANIDIEGAVNLDAVGDVGVADALGLDVERAAAVRRHRAGGLVGDGVLEDHLAARADRGNLTVVGQRVLQVEDAAKRRLQRAAGLVGDARGSAGADDECPPSASISPLLMIVVIGSDPEPLTVALLSLIVSEFAVSVPDTVIV